MANRVWQFRMGRGIEGTPNDFGVMGQHASNQALLDWLASEFVAKSLSVKSLARLIVLSSVYQQRSLPDSAPDAPNPETRFFSRLDPKRNNGETLHDAILSGT